MWLYRFSQLVIAATLCLIFIGGMVTTKDAGLAVPDWPLSFGSLNPPGWWHVEDVRLEHGHRLFASVVGMLVTVLTAWIWKKPLAIPASAAVSALATFLSHKAGLPASVVLHIAIWTFAGTFFLSLFLGKRSEGNLLARKLSAGAFICICLQATLGGLRVTKLSIVLAMVHGCVAQAFLCILIALAVVLSPAWVRGGGQNPITGLGAITRLGWIGVGAIYTQLILGAVMRHMKAGLAIPDFPLAFGKIIPPILNEYVAIHFSHRVGALVVTVLLSALILMIFTIARSERRLAVPALLLGGLVAFQIALGAHVIWLARAPVTTTLHVLNGAAVLGLTLVITMRTIRLSRSSAQGPNSILNTGAKS